MSITKETHIHWFVNDLRLAEQSFFHFLNKKKHHFGVFIIDPRKFEHLPLGFRKTGLKRIQYLREHLIDLQQNYRALGSDLLIIKGYPEKIIPNLVKEYDASISFQLEYATEERKIQETIINELDRKLVYTYEGGFLVHPSIIKFNTFPASFSGFRKKAEKLLNSQVYNQIGIPSSLPSSPNVFKTLNIRTYDQHKKTVFPFTGGETASLERLNNYLFNTRQVDLYKEKRNNLLGVDYSSKLSPWLSAGAISPLQIFCEIKRYEKSYGSNQGTYWLVFELLWRDYFRHAGRYYLDQLFYPFGIEEIQTKLNSNTDAFKTWVSARTGDKFIDANMKELALTGYMSNRGRQNAASYLVHNLKVDWRMGAAWFEQNLLDYDVYSNQGNWLYIAGLGFNPKGASIFDISFQTNRYDPTSKYQNYWINEKLS